MMDIMKTKDEIVEGAAESFSPKRGLPTTLFAVFAGLTVLFAVLALSAVFQNSTSFTPKLWPSCPVPGGV